MPSGNFTCCFTSFVLHKSCIIVSPLCIRHNNLFFIPNWDILIIPKWYIIVKCFKLILEKISKIMKLKELRKQKKISQIKLAMDLNISQNTISRYETGEREADYQTLIKIADYFDVSLDYLLERTDVKKNDAVKRNPFSAPKK